MPTPDFVLALREKIGHDPLPLVGVTAVIVRDGHVLLGRRSDNGAMQTISGIIEPGEEPADAAVREALEETSVHIRVDRLAWVHQYPRVVYVNGDEVDYLDLTFRCTWLDGDPRPADGELSEVGWYPLDDLGDLDDDHRRRVAKAVDATERTAFEGGDGPR